MRVSRHRAAGVSRHGFPHEHPPEADPTRHPDQGRVWGARVDIPVSQTLRSSRASAPLEGKADAASSMVAGISSSIVRRYDRGPDGFRFGVGRKEGFEAKFLERDVLWRAERHDGAE